MYLFIAAAAAAIAGVLAIAGRRPDTFRVKRSTRIKAAPQEISTFITDFQKWSMWSPYEDLDPQMKRTFAGAASGRGAIYEWAGSGRAGVGKMEIVDASPSRITIKLDLLKPFPTENIAEFVLEPEGDSTAVTWSMTGPNPYIARLIGLVVSMDKMVGRDFELGLTRLRSVSER